MGGDVTDLTTGTSKLIANDDSNLFNPLDNSLIRTGKMHRKRWYATATTLPNGELSFLHSPRPGNSATSNRFDVYWNGTRICRIWIDGTGLTDTNWQRVTLIVTGTGGSDRVSFFESGTDTDDRGALIDDVRLVPR